MPRKLKNYELGGLATAAKYRDVQRDVEIQRLHTHGVPGAEIARRLGISRQRVHQILNRESAA